MRDAARLGLLLAVGAAATAGGGSAAAKGGVPKNGFIEFIEIFTGQEIEIGREDRRELARAESSGRNGLRDGSLTPQEVADLAAEAVAQTDAERRERRRALVADVQADFDAPAEFALSDPAWRRFVDWKQTEARLGLSLSAQAGGVFSRIGKSLERAGAPTSLVIPGTDTSFDPLVAASPQGAAAGAGPILTVVGTPDGKLVVRTLDPSRGDASGLSWIGVQGPSTFDVKELSREADFSGPQPLTLTFTGLASGNYVLYAGNRIDLGLVPRDAQVVTVPAPAPFTPPGRSDIESNAKVLGKLFASDTGAPGSEFQRQVEEAVRLVKSHDLEPEDAVDILADGTASNFNQVWLLRQETLAAFGLSLAELWDLDPAAGDRAAAVGMRSPADALDASLAKTCDRAVANATRTIASAAKALAKRDFAVTYSIRGLGPGLHPGGAAVGLGATSNPLTDPLVALFGAQNGELHVVTRDPALGRGTEDSRVEILDGDSLAPVAGRDLSSSVDFGGGVIQPIRFLGLDSGFYFVVLTTDVQGLRVPVGVGAIFIPKRTGAPSSPPPITDTSFTATIDGAAYTTPPFESLRVNVIDGKLYGIYARFADSSNSSLAQFNFQISPMFPTPVEELTDAEIVVTKPPSSTGTLLYAFIPGRLAFTSEQSATYRVSGIKSLVDGTGGARVEVDAMWNNWNTMTPARFIGTMTLHTDDATR